MHRVGLQHLPEVEQAAQFVRAGSQLVHTDQLVHSFGRGQVMAHWTDTAEALDQNRQFPVWPTLNESFESAKFDNVQTGLLDVIFVVEQQSDFAMTFHSGYGVDDYPLQLLWIRGGFEMIVHGGLP
jgi:hypothetical protein